MPTPANRDGASVQVLALLEALAAAEAEVRRAQDDASDTFYDNLQHVIRIGRLLARIDLGEVKRQRLPEEKRQLKVCTPVVSLEMC